MNPRDWAVILAASAAVGVGAYGVSAEYGWFQTIILWPVHLFGLGMIALYLKRGGSKLALLLAPVFIVPLGMGLMLLFECSRGNCL